MSWLHFHCYCYFCSLSPGQWSARRPPLQTSPRASGIAGCSCWCCRCASGCVTFVKPVSVYHFWQHHRRHHSLTDNHLHQNASGISGETFFPICAWPEEQCLGSRVLVGGASQVVSMLIEFHIHIPPYIQTTLLWLWFSSNSFQPFGRILHLILATVESSSVSPEPP